MTQLLFYERPVPLNRERHLTTRLAVTGDHFRFAARTNAVPIASTEFFDAARDYPIVFVGEADGPMSVAALVGLRQAENLMVDGEGRWAADTYIPAFARRYPFVLAQGDAADEQQLTVCIDETYPGLGVHEGESLFDDQAGESEYLQRILAFLQRFHAEVQRTAAFAQRLRQMGLLVPKTIQVERHGQRQVLQGLWVVDVERYRAIDDARAVELFRSGEMAWIEAHLLSLGSLIRLAARLDLHSKASADGQTLDPASPPPDTPTH
jgi:hypothetical protein